METMREDVCSQCVVLKEESAINAEKETKKMFEFNAEALEFKPNLNY